MRLSLPGAAFLLLFALPAARGQSSLALHENRQQASDLEVGGELAGLPPNSTRFLTHEELLGLPQVSFTVTEDTNFTGPTKIRGVRLGELEKHLAALPASDMVIAICDDAYRAHYPRAYLEAHDPVLVLEVNGQPPSGWPKAAEDGSSEMGPYMITHRKFAPSYRILSHVDEAQIPWGVVRIEFREEKTVFGAIAPRGPHAGDSDVQAGYRIAQQNCYRCHNAGAEGGQKSSRSWDALAALAAESPGSFAGYIRAPLKTNPRAQMPGNPQYDDATLSALTAYFRTFSQQARTGGQSKP